jgi:hypothetical protein
MGTAALFGEPGLHPAAGVKPERSASPKGGGIDLLHGVGRSSSAPSPGTGPAAAHIDRRHCLPVKNDRRDAGRQLGVIGVTDADAGDIGEADFSSRAACPTQMTASLRGGQP